MFQASFIWEKKKVTFTKDISIFKRGEESGQDGEKRSKENLWIPLTCLILADVDCSVQGDYHFRFVELTFFILAVIFVVLFSLQTTLKIT